MIKKQKVPVPKKLGPDHLTTKTTLNCQMDHTQQIKTADIYQAAYLLAKGAVIEAFELTKELDKDICILFLTGESVRSHQETYINNQALINPVLYQKAINRIKEIVFNAVDQVKKSSLKGGKSCV